MTDITLADPAAPTVAILAPGEMGSGIGRLLRAHGYRVVTNIKGRSEATRERALAAGFEFCSSDVDLVNEASIILSIVPPAEALRTAKRIAYACTYGVEPTGVPRYYVDLNATSRATSEKIRDVLKQPLGGVEPRYLDGAIFGLPPTRIHAPGGGGEDGSGGGGGGGGGAGAWKKPRIAVSGPWELRPHLEYTLGIRRVGTEIGQASTLKMCFSTLTKGLTGLAVQSFATAHSLGMMDELREELNAFAPPFGQGMLAFLQRNLSSVPMKAYRWVSEMEEISDTHAQTGFDPDVFRGIAEVYRFVSEETAVGVDRRAGEPVETLAENVVQGLEARRRGEGKTGSGGTASIDPDAMEEDMHAW